MSKLAYRGSLYQNTLVITVESHIRIGLRERHMCREHSNPLITSGPTRTIR